MLLEIVRTILQIAPPDEFKAWCERKAGEAAVNGEAPASARLQEMWIAAHTIQAHSEPTSGDGHEADS